MSAWKHSWGTQARLLFGVKGGGCYLVADCDLKLWSCGEREALTLQAGGATGAFPRWNRTELAGFKGMLPLGLPPTPRKVVFMKLLVASLYAAN